MNRKLLAVIILATIVRLWYIAYAGSEIVLKPDSQGYYLEQGYYTNKVLTNFFNPHRTPGYAMITAPLIKGLPAYGSQLFQSETRKFIFIQTFFGILSLLFLFDTLVAIGISKKWSLAFTALTALNIYQFVWDRAFLTESLYISFFMVLMRLFVALLRKPTGKIGIFFVLLAACEFLLRPAGLAIPYILLPIVWLTHKTKKVFILMALLLTLYTAVPGSFVIGNKTLHGFKGIGYNADFGIFGRILLFDIPVEGAVSVHPWYERVKEYKTLGGNISIPWYFFVYYGNDVYTRLSEIQAFNTLVLRTNFWNFAQSVIQDIPKAFFDTNVQGVLYQAPTPNIFFAALDWIFATMQKTTIVFLFLVLPTVWLYIKKRTILSSFLLAIMLIELYQLVSSLTFGGAWEFARHMITTQTYLFFFCFWWIKRVWQHR